MNQQCEKHNWRYSKHCPECADNEYLIKRLERVIELINEDNPHMAVAKLLADISALKAS